MGRPKKRDTVTGVLSERIRPDGKRRIKLTRAERGELTQQRLVEASAALFLDLSVSRTWNEIAQELGISPQKLRDITKSEQFELAYSALFAELGHDPRYKAAQAGLMDLLPKSIRVLDEILCNVTEKTADRLKAIGMITRLTGVELQPKANDSDRQEFVAFLVKNEYHIDPAGIPDEYRNALEKYQIIEGQFAPLLPASVDGPEEVE